MDPEFGCEHLRPILEKNDKAAAAIYRSYLRVHRTRAIRNKKLLAGSSSSAKSRGPVLLKPSYVCLHCQFIASKSERDAHAKKFGHRFFVDSRTGEVYCQRCRDFVYDSNLERFLTSPSSIFKGGGSLSHNAKSSSNDQVATSRNLTDIDEEDAAYIASNTTKRSCGREGVRGLYNLGQTCYMNVILQTLLHDGFLTTYFLGNGHKTFECTDEHCVSCALCETFAEFNNDENTGSICSLNVLHASWVASPELGGNQQQDAHEFYQFLVDRLHCAAVSASPENKSCDSDCTCFFHRAFFGKLRSSVTCLKCGNVTRKDDPIMDLSLAFQTQNRHDAKMKSSAPSTGTNVTTMTATAAAAAAAAASASSYSSSSSSASTTRTLTGCLDSFTAPEYLTYSCSRCGDVPQQATKQLQIGRLPLILCIQLKRFERTPTTTEKVQGKIDFPLSINMRPYTTSASSSNSEKFMYDLSSAIVHTGTTVDSGHYYAYCRQGEQWFLFNDDKVLQVSIADVLNANAYLLFYTVRSLSGPKSAHDGLR
ncbi:hypothetical protein KEM54_002854 [Ascosphaera aggregata]|nr:hypothetical protein KEM54_002854 [Ascosphaera aggregata]